MNQTHANRDHAAGWHFRVTAFTPGHSAASFISGGRPMDIPFSVFCNQLQELHDSLEPENWPEQEFAPACCHVTDAGHEPCGGGQRRMLVAGEAAQ
jgi:hypothetical protein